MGIAALSDRGKMRSHNEDYYFIPDGERLCDNVLLVADGMGGHNAGDVASYIAVNAMVDYIKQHKTDGVHLADLMANAMQYANRRLVELSEQYEQYKGMGTTMTAAWITDERIYITHIGDSRAYLINESGIRQLTEDHSLVQEMINHGTITKDQAVNHPQRNVITRALGNEDGIEIDRIEIPYNAGDILLLCTDGLTCQLKDQEIWEICTADNELSYKADAMVRLANDRGGLDNITVILFQQSSVGEKEEWMH